jgi:multidrug efflux pump subunit AcrA (membrane-fusion protein)
MMPSAHREYHTTLAGRVELLVDQYDQVKTGTPLYRVDSPQWREMQQKLSHSVIAIRQAQQRLGAVAVRVAAVEKHNQRLHEEEKVWIDRVNQVEELIEAGSGAASELTEARSQLAAKRTSLAKVEEEQAEVKQLSVDLESELAGYRESMPLMYADALGKSIETTDGQSPRIDLALTPAANMIGMSVDELRKNVGSTGSPLPYWRTIDQIEFKAQGAGVVESLAVTNGAWVESSATVTTTVDPKRIRFRASGLQADLGRLRDGIPAEIVPPRGGGQSRTLSGSIKGTLTLGLEADPLERKIDLIVVPTGEELPAWARRGVSAEMEVVLDQTAKPQLAIPTSSVIKDGLNKVIFRRDPKDPNKVIRLEADLGLADGRWVVIQSGIMNGDEVVHHGVYELMLASGSGKQKGGHFHSDGTFHEGEH